MSFTVTLSASKIKTLQSCSFQYYSTYVLRLPNSHNSGSARGDCTHIVLECLSEDRRKSHVKKIIKAKDVFAIKSVEKLIYKIARRNKVGEDEHIEKIKNYVLNGLSHDFYGTARAKPIQTFTEKDFLLETDKYKARGFIDRLFIYKDRHALIRDYKTSKETYKGEDLNDPLQANMYMLAIHKMFPDVETISVEFLFLGFDLDKESVWAIGQYQGRATKKLYHNGGGKITIHFSREEILGFEEELADVQTFAEKFKEKHALSNLAFHQGMPTDDSFSGKLCCGFGGSPGELKKDGSVKFSCSSKWPFDFYHVKKDSEIVASCFLEDKAKMLHKYPESEFTWEKKKHLGCPAWNK